MDLTEDELTLLRELVIRDELEVNRRWQEVAAGSLDAKGLAFWRPFRQRGSKTLGFAAITDAGMSELRTLDAA